MTPRERIEGALCGAGGGLAALLGLAVLGWLHLLPVRVLCWGGG